MSYLPTGFIHEVSELVFVGEFIAMGIGLFPGFMVSLVLDYFFPGLMKGRLSAAVIGSISIWWILFLERRYQLKLTSPIFGIPLKWVLIPLFILIFLIGNLNGRQ